MVWWPASSVCLPTGGHSACARSSPPSDRRLSRIPPRGTAVLPEGRAIHGVLADGALRTSPDRRALPCGVGVSDGRATGSGGGIVGWPAVTARAQIGCASGRLVLPYRLYSIGERKKRASGAVQYNSLVRSWGEIRRMASADVPLKQTGLL